VLQCVAVSCSVLQCVAVCCSALQCVAVCCSVLQCDAVRCSMLQCVAVCCSVLQCVAVCCSMLQCAAVRCSVLQCVAVRCSVLQCVTDLHWHQMYASVHHHRINTSLPPAHTMQWHKFCSSCIISNVSHLTKCNNTAVDPLHGGWTVYHAMIRRFFQKNICLWGWKGLESSAMQRPGNKYKNTFWDPQNPIHCQNPPTVILDSGWRAAAVGLQPLAAARPLRLPKFPTGFYGIPHTHQTYTSDIHIKHSHQTYTSNIHIKHTYQTCTSNMFSRESSRFQKEVYKEGFTKRGLQRGVYVSNWSPRHSKECPGKLDKSGDGNISSLISSMSGYIECDASRVRWVVSSSKWHLTHEPHKDSWDWQDWANPVQCCSTRQEKMTCIVIKMTFHNITSHKMQGDTSNVRTVEFDESATCYLTQWYRIKWQRIKCNEIRRM